MHQAVVEHFTRNIAPHSGKKHSEIKKESAERPRATRVAARAFLMGVTPACCYTALRLLLRKRAEQRREQREAEGWVREAGGKVSRGLVPQWQRPATSKAV